MFFSIIKKDKKKNVSFIDSIVTLIWKIVYYLSGLSQALKFTSLKSKKTTCLFKFCWKVCKIKGEKKFMLL